MNRLRFALLFNGTSLERWHLDCLDQLEQVAELAGVIVTPEAPTSPPSGPASRPLRWYAGRLADGSRVDVAERFAHVPRSSAGHTHSSPVLPGLDFALKLGRNPFPADIDVPSRYGIWHFAHENETNLLPFFREVYEGEHVTYAALLTLDPATGETAILEEGYFGTDRRSYATSRDRVLNGIAPWPRRVSSRLLAGVEADTARRMARPDSPRQPGGRPRLLGLCAGIARRRLELAWERLFRHPQWNVGALRAPIGDLLAPGGYADEKIEWFPLRGRESFLSDPFGIERAGTLHVLCEQFGYREGKGHISALTFAARGFECEIEPAMTLPVHMSYPFLFQDADEIYCVPETCEAGEVALFRATGFPNQWSKAAVLVEGFAGVDPTVFRHNGEWWLMCTEKGPYEDVQLRAWHASDLLGPWVPHARNPIKTDVRGARPGGLPFVHGGVLYRPAQDCSKTYGWRIAVQRVTRLTPTEFVEDPVAVLEASEDSPFPSGRHTMTAVGDVVLVDGRRSVFIGAAFRAFLNIWARDLARKLPGGGRAR